MVFFFPFVHSGFLNPFPFIFLSYYIICYLYLCSSFIVFYLGAISGYFSRAYSPTQGPTWHGASGVHTHMTNTRITDAEVLERRYPVVLRAFALRRGSGGAGRWRGGDGVVRALEFRVRVAASILSERRVFRPYGRHGGRAGARGANWWVRRVKRTAPVVAAAAAAKTAGADGDEEGKDAAAATAEGREEKDKQRGSAVPKDILDAYGDDGNNDAAYDGGYSDDDDDDADGYGYEERYINLGGKNTALVQPGERIVICTPGGGGWGRPGSGGERDSDNDDGDDDEEQENDDDEEDNGGADGGGDGGGDGVPAAAAAHDARYAWRAGGSLLTRSQLQEQS